LNNHGIGISLALGALVLWSLTPFFLFSPGRRIGPYATNLTRLLVAAAALVVLTIPQYCSDPHHFFPGPAPWLLLTASGVIGLVIGDIYLYRSLFQMGPEYTSLMMTLSPAITAAMSFFLLGETLSPPQLGGMALVLGGVAAATWPKRSSSHPHASWRAAWNGIVSALLQGVGTVLARQAFLRDANLNPFFATTLRVGSGAVALALFALVTGTFVSSLAKSRDSTILPRIVGGAMTGPVIGMLCYITALKYQSAGVVTTITFMSPLLIIPLGTWRYRTQLGRRVIFGGVAALVGVALLGWNS